MSITLKELNPKNFPTTPEIDANLLDLLDKVNAVLTAIGGAYYVTSGLRTIADQKRIYADIARKKGLGLAYRVPMGSQHLFGCAVDIADADGKLYEFCLDNIQLLERVGIWCEAGTVGWTHMQSKAPGSGNRFFKP
jgi:uncharacterized protein YcbK (DUF882 family)